MNIARNLLAVAVLIPGVALAHAKLEMSVPAANSTIAEMPAQIMLHFSEATKLTALSIVKEGGKDKQDLKLPSDAKAIQMIVAPRLTPGVYVIDWRGLAGDTHIVKGTVKFTVAGK